jgi:hypothetical protein
MNACRMLIISTTLCFCLGCQQKQEDKTLVSWSSFVEEAKSGKAAFFQELSADMEANGFSYSWDSSEYRAKSRNGEIKIKVEPPESEPYLIGCEFELKDGEWEPMQGFNYRKKATK